jgi:hypothetical protein
LIANLLPDYIEAAHQNMGRNSKNERRQISPIELLQGSKTEPAAHASGH